MIDRSGQYDFTVWVYREHYNDMPLEQFCGSTSNDIMQSIINCVFILLLKYIYGFFRLSSIG